jgi:hypothetical protein
MLHWHLTDQLCDQLFVLHVNWLLCLGWGVTVLALK